jgi:hypothetical protein
VIGPEGGAWSEGAAGVDVLVMSSSLGANKVGEESGENIPEPPKTHHKNDFPQNLTILGTG